MGAGAACGSLESPPARRFRGATLTANAALPRVTLSPLDYPSHSWHNRTLDSGPRNGPMKYCGYALAVRCGYASKDSRLRHCRLSICSRFPTRTRIPSEGLPDPRLGFQYLSLGTLRCERRRLVRSSLPQHARACDAYDVAIMTAADLFTLPSSTTTHSQLGTVRAVMLFNVRDTDAPALKPGPTIESRARGVESGNTTL
jgi:hypothetical protein